MWVFGIILMASHLQTLQQFSNLQSANDDLRARLQQQETHTSDRLAQHASDVSAVKETLAQALEPEEDGAPRKLLSSMVVGTTAKSGCLATADADTTYTLSSADCVSTGVRCPQCFIVTSLSADRLYTMEGCSTARIGSAAVSGTQMIEYIFINTDADNVLTIRDGKAAGAYNEFLLGPLQQVHATCYTGGANQLYFESNYGGNIYDGSARRTVCPTGCNTAQPYRTDNLGTFSVYMAPSSITCSSSAHTTDAGAITKGTNDVVAACTTDSTDTNGVTACTADNVLGELTTFTYAIGGTLSNVCTR
jgi:hypothetical protein